MIASLGGHDVYVCCISAGRARRVQEMQRQIGPMTWYVPAHQWEEYRHEGAATLRLGSDTNAAEARNRAFRDAWIEGVPCCQLDDDMRWAKLKDFTTGDVVRITGREAIAIVLRALNRSDFKLGGIPNTNNPFFSRSPLTTRTHIRSHLWICKPCDLWIDEKLDAKFDYDYTLQHIVTYGGVCRVDEVICDFDYGGMKGGHVDTRRAESQERDIRRLERRWGRNVIKRNPRRPGEIVIHPPRADRVVL